MVISPDFASKKSGDSKRVKEKLKIHKIRPLSGTSSYNKFGKMTSDQKRPASIKSTLSSMPSSYRARAPSVHSTLGLKFDRLNNYRGTDLASESSQQAPDSRIVLSRGSRSRSPYLLTQAEIELLKLFDKVVNHSQMSNMGGSLSVQGKAQDLLSTIEATNFPVLNKLIRKRMDRTT